MLTDIGESPKRVSSSLEKRPANCGISYYTTIQHNIIKNNNISSIRFIDLRPSLELMYCKYGVKDMESYLGMYVKILNGFFKSPLDLQYIGSVESNKDFGYHIHLIVLSDNKTFKRFQKYLVEYFDIRHFLNRRQSAVFTESKMEPLYIKNKILYSLGIRRGDVKEETIGIIHNTMDYFPSPHSYILDNIQEYNDKETDKKLLVEYNNIRKCDTCRKASYQELKERIVLCCDDCKDKHLTLSIYKQQIRDLKKEIKFLNKKIKSLV